MKPKNLAKYERQWLFGLWIVKFGNGELVELARLQIQIRKVQEQNLMKSNISHTCLLFRVSNYYFWLTLLQLNVALLYLLALHHELATLSSLVEMWMAILVSIDITIKLATEKRDFWLNKWNIADACILCFIITSILFDWILAGNKMGAGLLIMRYSLQIYRVFVLAKLSKDLHEQQKYQGMVDLKSGMDVQVQIIENIETPN